MFVDLGLEQCERVILLNPLTDFAVHLQLPLSSAVIMGAGELLEVSGPSYCSFKLLQLVLEAPRWESLWLERRLRERVALGSLDGHPGPFQSEPDPERCVQWREEWQCSSTLCMCFLRQRSRAVACFLWHRSTVFFLAPRELFQVFPGVTENRNWARPKGYKISTVIQNWHSGEAGAFLAASRINWWVAGL